MVTATRGDRGTQVRSGITWRSRPLRGWRRRIRDGRGHGRSEAAPGSRRSKIRVQDDRRSDHGRRFETGTGRRRDDRRKSERGQVVRKQAALSWWADSLSITGARAAATPACASRPWLFIGPAILVGVGYTDPGNWATDLEGGSRFGYECYGSSCSRTCLRFFCSGSVRSSVSQAASISRKPAARATRPR